MHIRLDRPAILDVQRNRGEYLLIDVAEEVVPGVSARGYKQMEPDLFFFACHFPGDPTVPGLLQVEAIVQMAALALVTLPGNNGKVCYLTSADALKFKRKVKPGDRFDIDTRVLSLKRGLARLEGQGTVNGELACRAEFQLAMPDELKSFTVAGRAKTALPSANAD
jgi:3-hydroxyacyl-[acyl-carrier-protein] dehydratase